MNGASQPLILVVDDDARNRRLLDALLVPEGYTVHQAACGEDAIEHLRQRDADLVLLDVMMPGLDGFETCERIRTELGRLALPVVFITALGDRDSRVRGKQAGGDDFLSKPIDEQELFARVRNLLKVKAYHDLQEHQRELLEQELDRRLTLLLKTERLATLGTLAACVGHELNNIAQFLVTAVEVVRDKTTQQLALDDIDLQRFDRVVEHLATHAQHLLTFGNPSTEPPATLDFAQVATETVAMLKTMGRITQIDVKTSLPEQPVLIAAHRTRLEQVLINLITNAADALAETAGTRRVEIYVDPDHGDGRVRCRVEDNGPGIHADQLALVFEAFFTTKPPAKGTGLGLPVVRQIVEAYGGHVRLDSEVGRGTRVLFDLPAASA